MKHVPFLVWLVASAFSACTGGNPTAPSEHSTGTQTVPLFQLPNRLILTLASFPNPSVAGEPTTFVASASSSVSATLDFGDGARVALATGKSTTVKHIYGRGTFEATFTATDAAGHAASVSATVDVR